MQKFICDALYMSTIGIMYKYSENLAVIVNDFAAYHVILFGWRWNFPRLSFVVVID